MALCAKTEPGCEKSCPYAIGNEKFCQRALLKAAGRMLETLIAEQTELKMQIKELEYDDDGK